MIPTQQALHPALVWFMIGLVLLFMELAAPGLVIIFFGIGAWVVALVCLVEDISLNIQLVIFLLSSGIVLALLRNKFRTLFSGHVKAVLSPDKELDDFTGKKVLVKDPIGPNKAGKVEFRGTLWEAESDVEIPAGETAMIAGKENLTLKVKKV